MLFLTSGFYSARWGKPPSQDDVMNKVGDIHPSGASAFSFSLCKLPIWSIFSSKQNIHTGCFHIMWQKKYVCINSTS